ncbi:MAG: GIY-YIG nuclease family protein [Candidatus Omnitrophica bacterium]|nr:GIY-YIG nuclease family protein [Candidatus Omnitrophota bacterium]
MYYVYILLNYDKTHTYTGCTDNVERRLSEHNKGKVKTSKFYMPYTILHVESFNSLSEARQRERYFKTTSGRRLMKQFFGESAKT